MENRRSTGAELSDPEKTIVDSTSSFDLNDKDEALKLVGLERAESFTEEQYRRVRQKLVRAFQPLRPAILTSSCVLQDWVIPPLCQAVYCSQYL